MLQQISKGIKIAIETNFNGVVNQGEHEYFSFSYYISIENNSTDTVQLLERFWIIMDALKNTEHVVGKGVVGETPVLKPNDIFKYRSNCFLLSTTGAMKGNYKMINTETLEEFIVTIPIFQLTASPSLN
ncbi:Co2+/Mg2+ efflux protein ApaG [Tenacibaculum finnmarkense]|uniref:Co2+/Mg2+ efflux protein ApaG n=1 Tax=Tenacibaculum finnmarkense genomovar finnmarkense TaxID=1458503 RepID=A0AAP1RD12_9FLAO|nr:Co2+/Mg2+ efflux protein ApaG [Tenacibaculum finnmarkense]MBE7651596.1 Co2+/Mg2+ efflux protein ApaG [Tenacibaculum finnmarkense genomovar finnmarkense]MBE7694055.1 Co2+/Mg2+ efflux protein ApaG [Tenacibaculum finnmarkense genomovar finnmarkense]MCD8401495.1 Co2+/Mg2+ efflux protein ApaG [Tenacibaculum finnmarkense genomovar finnmarkense]MCD8426565.1 Co2+/Mg2+ efflux protein ApaG [Tenacibaculum finnmarkense genomovar finnmarkense]MCD8446437.1 Co2+/Mg2+ efflux protein ApaG [Tenacibaculum fin